MGGGGGSGDSCPDLVVVLFLRWWACCRRRGCRGCVWQRSSQKEVLLWPRALSLGGQRWRCAARVCKPSLRVKFIRVKAMPDPRVGADDGGIYGRRFPSWRHHCGFSLPTMVWSLRVETQASVCQSGRWQRHRRIPLVGVALESQLWWLCVTSPALGSVDVRAAAPNGGCASRRRPRDSWWAIAS
jgi:hypothetical protein